MPQDDLFADEATPATAAVMLGNSADTLAPGAVRGMAQTAPPRRSRASRPRTSRSPTRTGQLLWPSGRRHGRRRRRLDASRRPRRATPARWRPRSTRCSRRTLGPGKAQVQVNADLNVDKTNARGAHVRQDGRAAHRDDDRVEKLKGAGAASRRHRRHRLQRPDLLAAAAPAAPATRNYKPQDRSRPTTASTRRSPRPRRRPARSTSSNVALMVDKSVPPAVFDSLKQTVATAAGVDTDARRHDHRDADARSPRRRRRRPARSRRRCSARSSGSASASPRCSSCSS